MKFYSVRIALALAMAISAQLAVAQHVDFGILGGVRLTDDFGPYNGPTTDESKRYIVGGKLEVGLPLRLSVEVDGLYRDFGFTTNTSGLFGSSLTRERDSSVEFPMILKYRPPVPLIHLFVGVGYDLRTVHGTDATSGYAIGFVNSNPPTEVITPFYDSRSPASYAVTNGVVISGGVNLDVGRHLRLSPEARYVHWGEPLMNLFGSDGKLRVVSNQDEAFVLLGISWH